MKLSLSTFLILLLIPLLLVNCATSPTGRKQFILLPETQLATMGLQSFEEMKKSKPVEYDSKINSYVRCVVNPILNVAGRVEGVTQWEVVVFRDNAVNAFALPGGRIGVYTGMFKAAQNQDQLAAVLGHEVGHVIAQHGNERVSEVFAIQGGLAALDAASNKKSKNHGLLMAALGLGAQFGIMLPHSRTQESEADVIGLDLMAKAGFDPQESVSLWQNMAKQGGGSPPEFLSTHPSHDTRQTNLRKNMGKANGFYNERKSSAPLPDCKL